VSQIELTDVNGNRMLVPVDGTFVDEQPAGQTRVIMANGYIMQVRESVEEVWRRIKEAQK
jgi:uncharacterized protein YlzI (FlbEa/FlbD family)